jgi:hypothetical protein
MKVMGSDLHWLRNCVCGEEGVYWALTWSAVGMRTVDDAGTLGR